MFQGLTRMTHLCVNQPYSPGRKGDVFFSCFEHTPFLFFCLLQRWLASALLLLSVDSFVCLRVITHTRSHETDQVTQPALSRERNNTNWHLVSQYLRIWWRIRVKHSWHRRLVLLPLSFPNLSKLVPVSLCWFILLTFEFI